MANLIGVKNAGTSRRKNLFDLVRPDKKRRAPISESIKRK
jgi:hypothetical protein